MLIRTRVIESAEPARAAWPGIVLALLLACDERPDSEVAAAPQVSTLPAPPPAATAHPLAPLDKAADLSHALAREISPVGGGTRCLEMYSVCKTVAEERHCTSAPLSLDCGEEARLPSSGELLRCVCSRDDRSPNDPAS